jgi:hypothetical protein
MKIKIILTLLLVVLLKLNVNSQNSKIDINKDGEINILVLGSISSIDAYQKPFLTDYIALELNKILSNDTLIKLPVNVIYEEIYKEKNIITGVALSAMWNIKHFCHSLAQYYYWPDKREDRLSNLRGEFGTDWDYVVIGSDPVILKTMPSYYFLGVNKIASVISAGGAIPLLLMEWDEDLNLIAHFEEFTYRAAEGANVPIQVVPAGLAWKNLPPTLRDVSYYLPTPNGDYLGAASIYAQLLKRSASSSSYKVNDQIADIANEIRITAENTKHYTGKPTFISPFMECNVKSENLTYNHTGSSTEFGFLNGLNWVTNQYGKTLQYGENSPVHFNYGRSSMGGGTKEYKVDKTKYDFSFGFAIHDDARTGYTSMLYGLDRRATMGGYDTDLGTALKMVYQNEIPYARNIPLRTIIAQMIDEIPGIKLYPTGDDWHLSSDVNNAVATYIHTMLSGECTLPPPPDICLDSSAWRTWMAHKIGQETAWKLMYMEAENSCNKTVEKINACSQYTWVNGVTYDKTIVGPTFTYTNSFGCDSVVMLNLTFESPIANVIMIEDSLKSSIKGESYQWLDCITNSVIADANQEHYSPNKHGEYAVIVKHNGCIDTSSCYPFITVNTNSLISISEFKLFPNPNKGNFTINLGKVYNEIEVVIHNLLGQQVYSKNYNFTNEIKISLNTEKGVYFVRVKTNEGQQKVYKIIVD